MNWNLFIFHHLKKYLFLPDTLAPKALEIFFCSTFLANDSFEVSISFEKQCIHFKCLNTTEEKIKHHYDSNLRYNLNFKMVILIIFHEATLTGHQLLHYPLILVFKQQYFPFLQRVLLHACSVASHSVPLWAVACQVPLSMGFPRQDYWSGLPFFFSRGSFQRRD